MNIEFDNYLITADKNNFIVSEKYEKRDGKGKDANLTGTFDYREVSYHGTIEESLRKLLTLDLKRETVDSVDSLVETIRIHKKELETVYESLKNVLSEVDGKEF